MPDDYFDGVSEIDYMRQWDHKQWNEEQGTTSSPAAYSFTVDRVDEGSTVAVRASFINSPQHHQLLRLACHYFLETIPNEGLEETCEQLTSLLDFYSEYVPALDLAPRLTSSKSGQWGEQTIRPPIYVTEG
jgi:hypothetical protein